MVLQKKPSGAVVWGHGELGAMVTVTLSGASGLIIMEKTAQVKGQSQPSTRNWGQWFWWPKNLSEPKSELMVGVRQGLAPPLCLSRCCPGAAEVLVTSSGRAFRSPADLGGFSHSPPQQCQPLLTLVPSSNPVGAQREPSCCWSGWHHTGWSRVMRLWRGEGEFSFSPCLNLG